MRVEPVVGIFQHMEQLSPEAFKAQRQAELKDIAEFRARHLKFVKDWSDPDIRAKIQAKHAREVEEAQRLYADALNLAAKMHVESGKPAFRITPITKPLPQKRSWLARLFGRK